MIGDIGRPNLVMLRTVVVAFEKTFAGSRNRIPRPGKVKSMMYDHMEAALWFGAPQLVWLKLYLWNTLTTKGNGEKLILRVHWPLTQWLVKQVSIRSHSHFLPLICTLTFDPDTQQV